MASWLYSSSIKPAELFLLANNLVAVEIIAHAVLCVLVIGWGAGFQYYLFMPVIFLFVSPWSPSIKTIWATLYSCAYCTMYFYAIGRNPYIELRPFYQQVLYQSNIISVCVIGGAIAYLFYSIVNMVEEKLEKEHQRTDNALTERNQVIKHLNGELSKAAEYVKKILPNPVRDGSITTDWRFVPSTSLGGDAFGYHNLDEDYFAVYLLDVSGHGVGAALLSVSVINMLRSQSLPKTDFKNPEQVLRSLNLAFPSEANKDMFFTIWYGVYNENNRELTYASGGHPPAILFNGNLESDTRINLLRTPNYVIGGMPEATYNTGKCDVSESSTLYIYSDGVYEVEKPDGSMWRFHEFTDYMQKIRADGHEVLDRLYSYVRELGNSDTLEDDFTILEVAFS